MYEEGNGYYGNADGKSIPPTRPLFCVKIRQIGGSSRRGSMGQKEKTLQEMDVLVKKRKWKNRLGIVAVTGVVTSIVAGGVGGFIKTRTTAIKKSKGEHCLK